MLSSTQTTQTAIALKWMEDSSSQISVWTLPHDKLDKEWFHSRVTLTGMQMLSARQQTKSEQNQQIEVWWDWILRMQVITYNRYTKIVYGKTNKQTKRNNEQTYLLETWCVGTPFLTSLQIGRSWKIGIGDLCLLLCHLGQVWAKWEIAAVGTIWAFRS